mmetsp:Transcript_33764/g.78418  ORF Transcript_33764/g.78418 Transcript_33764/m.78418 type:complete len:248 (-) Transcript_33764:171-914(-)
MCRSFLSASSRRRFEGRAGRTAVTGATVITPGESTSQTTLTMSPSTDCRVPVNQCPSYSTSTRSPVEMFVVALSFKRLEKWLFGSKIFGASDCVKSTAGHFATTTAWEVDRWTRKIAGSGRGADGQAPLPLAETTSAPMSSHVLAKRCSTASSIRPRFRASVKRPAISACSSIGTDSFNGESPICHVTMRCNITLRPPTCTSPSEPHSKRTWRCRSTAPTSISKSSRNSEGSSLPPPAWILRGTTVS